MSDWWQCPRCTRTFESRGKADAQFVNFGDYDGVRVCGACLRVLWNQASPEERRRHNDIVRQENEAEERKEEERKKRHAEEEAQLREKIRKDHIATEKFRKRPLLCFFNILPFPMIVYMALFFLGLLKLHFSFFIALVVSVIFALISLGGHFRFGALLGWKPAEWKIWRSYEGKGEGNDYASVPTPLRKDYRLYILISLVVFVLGMAVSFGGATLGAMPSDEQAVEAPADAETAHEAASN